MTWLSADGLERHARDATINSFRLSQMGRNLIYRRGGYSESLFICRTGQGSDKHTAVLTSNRDLAVIAKKYLRQNSFLAYT